MNIGRFGESYACNYLLDKKFQILERNYYTRIGEIDIIAKLGKDLVFIEVKTRIGIAAGYPYEAITPKKLSTIRKVGRMYLQKVKTNYRGLRIDVISIVLADNLEVIDFKHFENADL